MFKSLVISVILCQGIWEIFGQQEAAPRVPPSRNLDDKGSNIHLPNRSDSDPEFRGQYFYSPQQTIYVNFPSTWKWPTNLGNISMEVRSDYTVTAGVGAHKVHRRKLTWNSARRICIEEGGHLADIRTIEEMKAIKTLMAANSLDGAWVGFHDMFQEGDWVTILDEPLGRMRWSPWSTKFAVNPDNSGGNENCAIFLASHDGLNDDTCSKEYPFVCKISA